MVRFIIIFLLTSLVIKGSRKIIENYNDKFEKVMGIDNELVIVKRDLFGIKNIYIDLFNIKDLLIRSLSFNSNYDGVKIQKFKVVLVFLDKKIFINKKDNVLKIVKAIKVLDENLYYKLLDKTVFVLDPIRLTLEKEMEDINIG
ncbi:hypothetical protein HP397_01325 [Streptobacillus felis]|uniref:Uncharacterized protein n=1 Tax=Streptobacillus felis TaxID=1384509 RepID=A0A7Z0T829_9FUSO|nr:hypothetical protein [Streptobacillus felis]NYV27469.1 hypothetical protein [Streptobacillus felis]